MDSLEGFNSFTDLYIKKRETLKLVIVFIDSRVITNDDIDMVSFLKENNINFIVLMNKVDKLKKNDILKRKNEALKTLSIEENKLVLYSSSNLYGKENVLQTIENNLF